MKYLQITTIITKLIRFLKRNFQLATARKLGLGLILILAASLSLCFDLFNKIYCDDESKTENDNYKEENNKESQNKGKYQEDVAAAFAAAVKNNDTATDFDIPSILEAGDEISPLQAILNNEIGLLLLILVHMVIIAMILFNKFYVSKSLNLISKLFRNSKILVKFERYKIIIDKLGNRFLNLLLIINITCIIVYVLLLLYVNIKLSSNLDDFTDVHNNMKKGMILFINSKFLFCLDYKHRNRCCVSCSLKYYLAEPSLVGFYLKPRQHQRGFSIRSKKASQVFKHRYRFIQVTVSFYKLT